MADNSSMDSPCTGDYFVERQRINSIRAGISRLCPSAADIIRQLEISTERAGFDPVGALHRWKTIDTFFSAHPRLRSMEEALAGKIQPDNVSEVLDLLHLANTYKPSSRVMQVLYQCLDRQLEKISSADPALTGISWNPSPCNGQI